MSSDPFDALPSAGAVFRLLHPQRWRPHRAVFLLDSRFFRLLISGEGERAASFRASLVRHGLAPGGELPLLQLTPLGFLDAIGFEPPRFDPFPLPAKVVQVGESSTIAGLLIQLIVKNFREAPATKPDALRKRVDEMRQATDPAALELFDVVLTRFVSVDGFAHEMYNQLAFDTLYRFPFPDVLREDMFHFFSASLFAAGETVSGLSKMRMVKMIWERAYERVLRANPAARLEIQALDRELKPRKRKEYLDWEVFHHAVLGYGSHDLIHPVVGFSLATEEKVKARCIAYKTAIRAFLDQIEREDLSNLQPQLTGWKPGLLAPCQDDGTFETPIAPGTLPIFTGGREAK